MEADKVVSPSGSVAVLARRYRELCADVKSMLDLDIPPPRPDGPWADEAKAVLGRLWNAVMGETLRRTGETASPALVELLGRIRAFESELAEARLADRHVLLRSVAESLASLRDAKTVDDFLSRVPEAGCRLGFDRVLVSTVEDSVWRLHTMCVTEEPRWADEIVAVGKASPPQLGAGLVEGEVVESGRPRLIFDAQRSNRVDKDLIHVTKSTSYGVAPLTLHGEVAGLLHGDCYHQRRDVDETDQALLSVLAEALSHSLGRLTVLEGVAFLRGAADRLLTDPSAVPRQAPPAPPAPDPGLTAREIQVMELLAAGHANRHIAQRLVISERTAKSHITSILRKLGVSSRTEAMAYWLRRDLP
ncbi:LuxR C-terminal-related transcriptional regulator [Amycolatopsis japonica]|uniref:LuxR C-terminal-related transcriptional regulator n=1 Tax=Amycolatopsis TaxID=1813 RepID=UPI0006924961|nr:LuxR C-terminal-related transcriptional regulator [Amycolatopsis sp. MJM2582]